MDPEASTPLPTPRGSDRFRLFPPWWNKAKNSLECPWCGIQLGEKDRTSLFAEHTYSEALAVHFEDRHPPSYDFDNSRFDDGIRGSPGQSDEDSDSSLEL